MVCYFIILNDHVLFIFIVLSHIIFGVIITGIFYMPKIIPLCSILYIFTIKDFFLSFRKIFSVKIHLQSKLEYLFVFSSFQLLQVEI